MLGELGGDTSNHRNGRMRGVLFGGHTFRLTYQFAIETHSSDDGAESEGFVELLLVPVNDRCGDLRLLSLVVETPRH